MSQIGVRIYLLMACVGGALYWGAWANPFHFDDLHSVQYNPHIRSLANVPSFFVDLHTFSSERAGTMFRPLLLCSYALNYALHGEWVVGFRIFNLLLHISCAFLVWQLVRAWFGELRMAHVVGGLFLLHPLAAEPINYISSRSDLLSAFFVLLALWAFTRSQHRQIAKVLSAFVCALLVKSVAIVLPALCAVGMARGERVHWERARGPLAGMGAVALLYIGLITANRFLPSSLEKVPRALDVHIWTQIKAWTYAIGVVIMPVNLSVDHLFIESNSWAEGTVLSAAFFLSSLGVVGLFSFRRCIGKGILWWFVALSPYALIPLNIIVSERRLYLASVGLILIAGWALSDLLRRQKVLGRSALASLAVFSLLIITARNGVWASDITLWEDALREGRIQPRAQVNLALAYARGGRLFDAKVRLEKVVETSPEFADAWVELGNLQHETGDMDRALRSYERAVRIQPWLAGGHYNLGNLLLAKGNLNGAVERFERALKLNPNFAMAHNNLAQAKEGLGQWDEAMAGYRSALEIDAEQPQAWFNLANLLESTGALGEAGPAYLRAHELIVSSEEYGDNGQYRVFAQRALAAANRLGARR